MTTNVVKLFSLTPAPNANKRSHMKLFERLQKMQELLAKKLGETAPVSLSRIAAKAGVSRQAINRIERNSREHDKEGGYKALRRIAEAWEFSVDWLISGRGDPQQKALSAFDQALASEAWDAAAVAAAKATHAQGRGDSWPAARWQTYLRKLHELAVDAEKQPSAGAESPAEPKKLKRAT